MRTDEVVDRSGFHAARTAATTKPDRTHLRRLVERMWNAKGPPYRWNSWGPAPHMNLARFWLLPTDPLSLWTPSVPYLITASYGSKVGRGGIGAARLEQAFELLRTVPSTVALRQLMVSGFIDKPRPSAPHIRARLQHGHPEATQVRADWEVEVEFAEAHPGLQAGQDPGSIAAPVRRLLGRIDEVDIAGRPIPPDRPTRSGLTDAVDAWRIFRDVVEAAIPHPTKWAIFFSFNAYQWGKWTAALNDFALDWCYGGNLVLPHGFDPYARPKLINPGRPDRIPLASWKSGEPPKLQINMVHAAEGSWLEFETMKGRARLDEVAALVGPLESWEGPPHARWAAG